MRTHKVKIGSSTLDCATTFKANMAITDQVIDPMVLARDEMLAAEAQKTGLPHTPVMPMTVLNVVKILHAGHAAGGGSLTLEEVGDMVMEAGPVNVLEPLGLYLAALVAGTSAELPKPKKGDNKKAAASGNA